MATTKQKTATRRKIKKPRAVRSRGLSTRRKNRLPAARFAFTRKRKEPITDARHVRNAIARFDQVQGVTDAERDAAWKRIRAAARRFGIEIRARGWRSLMKGGKTGRRR